MLAPWSWATPGSVSLPISLAGGLQVDVTVEFESVTNLSLANVGISAAVIDPLDTGLTSRLPSSMVSSPAAFPVLVLIEPPPGVNALSFTGVAVVTLDTVNLPYYENTRLRLFSAHAGGNFRDITDDVSQGSYRVRGSQGEFSEFLIVQDDRINDNVVGAKMAALQTTLTAATLMIDPFLYTTLSGHLADAEVEVLSDDRPAAIVAIDEFIAAIVGASSLDIPSVWAASGGSTNVAGILRSMASSLRFSLGATPCPAAGDYTDADGDLVPDECDNCTMAANPEQCDTDGDGYGNLCDSDLNNNGVVNTVDLGLFKSVFFTADPDADFNCNGVVNVTDLGIMKLNFLAPPGPSGVAP